MILEVATLQIKPGQTAAFEAAFAQAQKIIASMYGYLGHELQHCLEDGHQYVAHTAAPFLRSVSYGVALHRNWVTCLKN
jgi:heme-degrading monooxygenase HmoA